MKRLFAIGILVISYFHIYSQDKYNITGIVYDQSNLEPIENVEIIIQGNDIATITNKEGEFVLVELSSEEYNLLFKHLGYEEQYKSVSLKNEKDKKINIYLSPLVRNIKGVVVEDRADRYNIISKLPYIQTNIVKSQFKENAARDIGDFLRSSNNISGIRKGGTGIDPVVRGLKYSQLNVQINNGLKIEGGCPNRMDPATAHIEVDDIESIEIYKGPYALKFGPSFGGVINIKTLSIKKYDSLTVNFNAMKGYESNWNGNKEQIGITGGNKFLFFKLSGGRKDYGHFNDGDGNEVSSAFKKYNYGGHLGILPGKNHEIIFSYENSQGRDIRFPALAMDERKDDTELISADYHFNNPNGLLNTLFFKIYNSDVKHEMDNKYRPFSDTVVAVSIIHAINRGFRLETGFNFNENHFILGTDYENISKDGERVKTMITQPNLPVKTEKLWNNAKINNLGFFAEFSRTFNKYEIIGVARMDFNNGNSDEILIKHPVHGEIYKYASDSISSSFVNFSISGGMTRHLNKRNAISLSIGRGVRSPDMAERYIILLPIGYDKFDYLGNPQLKPEANNQADLTYKYTSEKRGMLQVNAFFSIINNYITGRRLPPSEQKPLTKDVLGVKQFYNAGNAKLRGFEISYSTSARNNFVAMLFASYTYATIDEVNKYILNEQGDVIDETEITNDALSEIPPFESTLTMHYRFLKGKFVPKINIRMVAAQNHVSDSQHEVETPGFMVAGVSFNYHFNRYLQLSAGVNNLFDTYYYEHLNRNILGSASNLSEPGRVFFINLYIKL